MSDQDVDNKRKSEFGDTCGFVGLLAKSMQLYGVSSETMIGSLSRIAKSLGLNSAFLNHNQVFVYYTFYILFIYSCILTSSSSRLSFGSNDLI